MAGPLDDPNLFTPALRAAPTDPRIQALYNKEAERLAKVSAIEQGGTTRELARMVGGLPVAPAASARGVAAAAPAALDDGSYARKELARARDVTAGFTGADRSAVPAVTDMGFGITKRTAPGETTEYSNVDPATGRPRAYGAPYVAADGTPTTDWTKTAAYAEGVQRAEKDITEAALLDIGEAARRTSGASGERERKAAIARARLRLDPTGGAAARRAEVATGVTAQHLAQAARLNQLQAQYLAETDPVKQAALAAQLQGLSGKGEEFKGVELSGGERVETVGGVQVPLRQPGQLALVGSRGTVRQAPVGQPQAQQPAVGVRVAQKDGTYPLADGRKATVKGGVITEIK